MFAAFSLSPCGAPPVIADARLIELYRYWHSRSRGRAMPSRADIDPTDIPRLLPSIILTDVVENGRRFRYRLVGTTITHAAGLEMTGRYLDEVLPGPDYQTYILSLYRQVADRRRPVYSESEFIAPSTGTEWQAIRLLLPLSSDGVTVDIVLAGQVFADPNAPSEAGLHRRVTVVVG